MLDRTLDAARQGVDQQQAGALVAKAHTICPYSKATRGNIEVKLLANGKSHKSCAGVIQRRKVSHLAMIPS